MFNDTHDNYTVKFLFIVIGCKHSVLRDVLLEPEVLSPYRRYNCIGGFEERPKLDEVEDKECG